jgi:molybdenum cofactor guanylyltransferase
MIKSSDITAVILAGGKNSRIQQEKSLLNIRGTYLIDRQVELLSTIFEQIIIVTAKDIIKNRFPAIRTIEDEFFDCGPLGGIHAAIKNSRSEAVFVFACDMPNLSREIINKQIETYHNTPEDVLVPRHEEGIEPLHAIYSSSNLPFLEKCLNNRSYSVRSFYQKSNTRYLDFDKKEIPYFFNINTHSDLSRLPE